MKTLKIVLILVLVLVVKNVGAQVTNIVPNTNIVILTGAGSTSINGPYGYDPVNPGFGFLTGYFTNSTSAIYHLNPTQWDAGDYYLSGNFPTNWSNSGYAGSLPDPTGAYGLETNISYQTCPQWTASLTNFFILPGDSVTFRASGRNMASNTMTGLQILLDGNMIYTSTFTAGKGNQFSLDGRMQWDGTNIYTFAEMASGDPSNVQTGQFNTLASYPVGTNVFQLTSINNTNGLVLLSASITASRSSTMFTQPPMTNSYSPGSITLKTVQ